MIQEGFSVENNGQVEWREVEMLQWSDDDFLALGSAFENTHTFHQGDVGQANSKLFDQAKIVDFGVQWLSTHRA